MRLILQRYLAASFILPFIVGLLFFISFLLTFQLFKVTSLMINKGADFYHFVDLLSNIALTFLPMAVPLSVLFASIFTLNKFTNDSEYIVMRALGLSEWRIFRPLLILGLLISAMIFILNESVIPQAKREFRHVITYLSSKGMLTDIKEGQFYTEIPAITVYAEKVDSDGSHMQEVFIHVRNVDKEEKVIFARQGILEKPRPREGQNSNLMFHLFDGNIVQIKVLNPLESEKIIFKQYDFPIDTGMVIEGVVTKDSMRTTSELADLVKNVEKREQLHLNAEDFIMLQLEYWTRINNSLLCLVFIFLGYALGIQRGRGKSQNTAAICFFALAFYYGLFFAGIGLARSGWPPPILAVFLPTFIIFCMAFFLFQRLRWVG